MPIYEYECKKCACRFELKRRFDEGAGSPCCPQCQGKVRRIFSPSLILFKGSGFYITDSRNDHNWRSDEAKADKVEGKRREEGKGDKVKGDKKEEGKADKIEGKRKEEGKGDKKEEGKVDKVDGGKKEESK